MRMRRAFTLPEVMMALFVLSTSMFVLGQLQMRSMMRVYQSREEVDRLFIIKKYLYRMYLSAQTARKMTQKFDEPSMSLSIEPVAIHKKSVLFPYASRLQFLRARGEWESGTSTRGIDMVTLAPLPPQKKQGESS